MGSSARKTFGRCASAAQSATRCCSPPESSVGRRSPSRREPDPVEKLVGSPSAFGARHSVQAELERRRAPARRAPAPARGRSAGRRSRAATSGTWRGGARAASPRSSPYTRTRPADGRSRPASSRSSVDLPEPLGPSTVTTSPSATRSDRPCSAAASPSGVEWTRKTSFSSIAFTPPPRRLATAPVHAGASARRRAAPPRATYAAAASRRSGQSSNEPQRRLGRVALAVTETRAITSDVRMAPRTIPPERGRMSATRSARSRRCARIVAGDAPWASRSNSSPRSSRTSPTTTSSKPTSASSSATAAVPASVSSDPRAERIGLKVGERRRARLHRELCERRATERRRRGGSRAAGTLTHSSSTVPSPGERVSSSVLAACRVGDDSVAVDRREPADDADDPRCDLLAFDLERNDPVRP